MGFIDSGGQRRFSDEKMRKVNLFETGEMFCDVYCLRPGQAQHVHSHAGATKFYYVIEGEGRFTVGEAAGDAGAGRGGLVGAGRAARGGERGGGGPGAAGGDGAESEPVGEAWKRP